MAQQLDLRLLAACCIMLQLHITFDKMPIPHPAYQCKIIGDASYGFDASFDCVTLQSKAGTAGSGTQEKFQKQKNEVIGESKANIKEAEDTLKVTRHFCPPMCPCPRHSFGLAVYG